MNSNAAKFLGTPEQKLPDSDYEIDLAGLVAIIWRGKVLVTFYALLALLVGAYYVFFAATPIFSASTAVALENRQSQIVDLADMIPGLPNDQASINTEVEILKSRRLVEKLVEDLDLVGDPEFNKELGPEEWFSVEKILSILGLFRQDSDNFADISRSEMILDDVIDEVLDRLSVSNVRQSYVFTITARTENPVKSARITDRLAELYIQDQIILKLERTEEATEWLTDRVSTLQVELEVAETELETFSRSTDLTSPEGLMVLNRQLKDLRTRRDDLRTEISALEARLSALEDAKASGDTAQMAAVASNPSLSRLLEDEDQTRTLFTQRYNQLMRQINVNLTRAEEQETAVATSIRQLTLSIDTQADELLALQQLQREAEASRLIYEYFLGRLKETSVQQGVQQAESRILSYAVVPQLPTSPRKPIVLFLSLLLGVMVGVASVLWREYSKNTYRLASDLEANTGYPVLGQVPLIAARRRNKVLKYLKDKPNSAAAEAIRNLRTSLLLSDIDNPPKVIMSTSSVPGEGKTTQSIALAQNLAGLGKKTLLLEGDIRRRVFGDYFDTLEKPGFLQVLLGEVKIGEAITHLEDYGIDVLLGEQSTGNAADVFSSERFAKFINGLRNHYDYVVIDTPPVLAVTDARIIGRVADAIIYTVKWDSTSHRQVADGLRSLEQVNLRVSGLVLGQINSRGMKRYGYGDSVESYAAYYDQ